MASLTFAVDEELKSDISKFSWITWSELIKQELKKRLEFIEFLDSKLDKSEFSEKDSERLGDLAKTNRLKELKSKGII